MSDQTFKIVSGSFQHGPIRDLPSVLGGLDMPGFIAFPFSSPPHFLCKGPVAQAVESRGGMITTDGADFLIHRLRLKESKATATITVNFSLMAALMIARDQPVTILDILTMKVIGEGSLQWRFKAERWGLHDGTTITFDAAHQTGLTVESIQYEAFPSYNVEIRIPL